MSQSGLPGATTGSQDEAWRGGVGLFTPLRPTAACFPTQLLPAHVLPLRWARLLPRPPRPPCGVPAPTEPKAPA